MDYFAKVLFSVQTHHLKKIKRMNISCFLSAKGKLSQKSKAFWTNLVCDAIWQKSGLGNIVPDCLAMIHFSSKAQASTKILSEMEVALRYKLLTLQYVAKAASTAALFTLLTLFTLLSLSLLYHFVYSDQSAYVHSCMCRALMWYGNIALCP